MQLKLSKDLTALRAAAIAKVNSEAEQQRLKYITPGSGQAMVYLVKENQARACISGLPGPYPLLEATVGIERDPVTGAIAQTVEEVAQIVLGMANQWTSVAAHIEAVRFRAIIAIEDAATPAAIEHASNVDWSL